MNILIIGAGKVGTALAGALQNQNTLHLKLYDIAAQTEHWPADFPPFYGGVLKKQLIDEAQLIMISVSDDAIPAVTEKLLNFNLRQKHVLHTSGFHTSGLLKELQERGALTASWHPLQTFHKRYLPADIWRGVVCTYEGAPETRELTEGLCRQIGCRQIEVSPAQKQALHLAATLAANHSVALLAMAEQLLKKTGLQHDQISELLSPLMQRMLDNFRQVPAKEILSGPARRGDVNTLSGHLTLLKELAGKEESELYLAFVHWIAGNFKIDNPQQIEHFLSENPLHERRKGGYE